MRDRGHQSNANPVRHRRRLSRTEVKDSIRYKLESVSDRFEEITGLLADPDVISDQNQFRALSKEYARVEPIVKLFGEFETLDEDIKAAQEMADDTDSEIRQMGQEELQGLTIRRDELMLELQKSLIPPDPNDAANVFLEVRAGTG
ncbi:MAG: PCRF domain-containing protein, partial [Woeseiaceae bacterium]|nr:PCRF domain-containing protein [Woeseiaceae bacterium]